VEELISPILSLELVKSYYKQNPDDLYLPSVPVSFSTHQEYMESWMPLFLYEAYNQLISNRSSTNADRELSELLGAKHTRNDDEKHFTCQIKRHNTDFNYVYLRVYDDRNMQGK
jgi:hypothetical protein